MTFSIIARDEETGRIGVAVASKFFAVGARNAFVRTGVGRDRHSGIFQSLLRPARSRVAGRRRDGDRCGTPADHGRRGPPPAATARNGSPRTVRRPHRAASASSGADTFARDLSRRGQHSERRPRDRSDGRNLWGKRRHRVRPPADRNPAGGRGRRRRYARPAVGRTHRARPARTTRCWTCAPTIIPSRSSRSRGWKRWRASPGYTSDACYRARKIRTAYLTARNVTPGSPPQSPKATSSGSWPGQNVLGRPCAAGRGGRNGLHRHHGTAAGIGSARAHGTYPREPGARVAVRRGSPGVP